jgi:2-C-methyl-D-erythritol 4-phosphate cytidylyltransferase
MVAWAVEAVARAELVGPVVVAAPRGREGQVGEALNSPSVEFVTDAVTKSTLDVVAGGETRAESVRNALARVETELVVIHDAARPLATPSLVDCVLRRLCEDHDADGVIAATPVTDTVKRVDGATITATESREALWGAQTPQAFRTAALRRATAADDDPGTATDEAMVVERAGGTVLIEPAPAWNLKVTTADELRVAELLLEQRAP